MESTKSSFIEERYTTKGIEIIKEVTKKIIKLIEKILKSGKNGILDKRIINSSEEPRPQGRGFFICVTPLFPKHYSNLIPFFLEIPVLQYNF